MALTKSKRYSLEVDYAQSSFSRGDASNLFKDALKKMDSVIGIETSTFGHETGGHKLASLCKQLQVHILSIHPNGSTITPDPRTEIPAETRDFLVAWLTGDPRGSPFSSQLQHDRETLLQQVQTLEKNLDNSRLENDSLKKELRRFVPSNPQYGHTRTHSAGNGSTFPYEHSDSSLMRGEVGRTSSLTGLNGRGPSQRVSASGASASGFKRQRSFRESFRKAFSRKGNSSKDITQDGDAFSKPPNNRAQHFHSLSGPDLASWMSSIGLDIYGEMISQLVVTGERLASIATNTEDLVRLGVLNVLHCKKLKLAVENAVAESPSPLSYLDHHWVADWLSDIGLPQYRPPFMDARIDAQMLNHLSMEDLSFLKIDNPFHIASMKRSIQAFRMCGYDPNYLKMRQEKGSYKLLHWSVYHLMDWLRDIELDEFADKLQGTGISGPVVALEASFTHESLAKAVGINPTKGLIIAHLGEKFLALIGPTCAQRKVDVMQHKHFTPMDPMEQPPKVKGRSKPSKRSKQSQGEETFLCPLTELPPVHITMRPVNALCAPVETDHTLRNMTISSETGQRRSFVYSPTPLEPRVPSPCSTPPLSGHTPSLAVVPPTPCIPSVPPMIPSVPPITGTALPPAMGFNGSEGVHPPPPPPPPPLLSHKV